MFQLKLLSPDTLDAALEKATRYRLLGESRLAESICDDVLAVDPDRQDALVVLVLALSDQFGTRGPRVTSHRVDALLPRLKSDYDRAYLSGLVSERRGLALLDESLPGSAAASWLLEAMEHYERAAALRPPGNDDALLRWNTCARILDVNGLVGSR